MLARLKRSTVDIVVHLENYRCAEAYDTLFVYVCFFFFQAEDGIRDGTVTGVQTCALPILPVLGNLAKTHAQGVEVNRLLKITGGTQLFAVLFRLRPSLAAYDDYRDFLRMAEGGKGLKQFVAGILRHAQIEQNSIRTRFKGNGQALLRLTGVDDFVGVTQLQAHQTAEGCIVVHN